MNEKENLTNEVIKLEGEIKDEVSTQSKFKTHIANLQSTGIATTKAARNLLVEVNAFTSVIESLADDIKAEGANAKAMLAKKVLD